MIVRPFEGNLIERIGQSTDPRTLGVLHLSDIIKRFMQLLQPKRFDPSKPIEKLNFEVGLLVESAIQRELAIKYSTIRPGELIGDMLGTPIYMTPDGVNPTFACGEEYKATKMSSAKGLIDEDGDILPKFLHWVIQMKGYAKWLCTNTFILTVLWIGGDYKWIKEGNRSIPPKYELKQYWFEFSDEEIEDNWTMLTNFARDEGMLVVPF